MAHSRDYGGSFTLNNLDDGTPIKEMLSLGKYLYLITEKCTYRVQMADQVDPERKNLALPPVFQQKLFDLGTDSELLRRTLMQARVLFRKEFLCIDPDKAMELTLEALAELAALHEACENFAASEQAAIDKLKASPSKDGSQTVPSAGNVQTQCKAFAQKADHFAVKLMEIVRLFYPEQIGKNWDNLQAMAKGRYGDSDPFCQVLNIAVPMLKLMRNTRDCLEHHLPDVVVRDFEPEPDGGIAVPTIEVNFRGSSLKRCRISSFMSQVEKHLLDTFEMFAAHMSSKHMKSFAGMPVEIGLLPEDVQNAWRVRFAYGMYDQNGRFVPCG
ncbi:hypothetical protein [Burkholderia pseudomallei]|uniref:hypothetical protein n=1 Tax=Burkholderia pseudomallei TaxID=28450 RepID=UPI0005375CDC|nr:hypothetical protein [Burkholderia pseudomallei]KGU76778.1 hypothetical protein Y038_1074 [Burkholderia pseudomallei MSHR543]OMW63934.1 hypothetical protein AQ811_22855 [Burkholderia pseudomallei]OMZ62815.1 hypothetical protein AQ865_05375 [Burkholderia pseudomallei]ONC13582.1 hypothetical protein AQ912_26920 [Burkholderia pseudomallei]